ncbi:uncharacterized protein OCT59_025984 [Rhizophagus irregularis]|uniref:Uncharacterized protein n=3 Tax=Rhizophagus irregularis TaxID=588596 RepID=U9SRM8_RHIID|nr:hypothetical protein GLOIN_2v1590682 [Rhizophagus irregularis DAOM 181602=DAOM 197198]EXX73017.1 hypothetical protein RirG_063990 [Rhizophagus irregularis DAOM 197198w]UZO05640.1 hypothetical protein OCT59_025984 [Rhizophagus irregularis]POG72940.1 hypothetical protein GLOIN_2v1590682 [Rhizophagus irregularis DAOM 181602=DAOM 197198]CAB4478877.1 unnamed protein product [Rhizophagus irregularis]CAB5108759.1 unnamed protein product [Rhizophagus irregularis]|eukprot:XP_025179806.1 hypothetical protein GLOIN_2v1590682 [Rhizophagus irregularis DAOM 181602=DAOM 197198]
MKSSYSFVALVTFLLSVSTTNANIFPTNPDGGAAIFTPNQKVSIEWKDDGKAPNLKALGVVLVEFMTGADLEQVPLEPIGKVTATVGKIAWVVPEVDPPGKFYFLRFSNGKVDDVYTTRFTITGKNGKYPAETIPPPAVGKNLGKVGKIVAKGDPNGPVPKEVGVGNPNPNETPKQPALPADDTLKDDTLKDAKTAKKTPNNDAKAPDNSAKAPDNPTPTNNIFPSAFVSGNNNTITTSSAFSINYNIDIIGVLTFISLLSSMII